MHRAEILTLKQELDVLRQKAEAELRELAESNSRLTTEAETAHAQKEGMEQEVWPSPVLLFSYPRSRTS